MLRYKEHMLKPCFNRGAGKRRHLIRGEARSHPGDHLDRLKPACVNAA